MGPNYAAAVVHFLDREDGSVKTMYCYPITRIEFVTLGARPQAAHVVSDSGEWIEERPPAFSIPSST